LASSLTFFHSFLPLPPVVSAQWSIHFGHCTRYYLLTW